MLLFLGVDSHKDSLAACLVDQTGAQLAAATFPNTPDYKQAIALSADRPQRQPVFYDNLADVYDRLRMPRDAEGARNKARSLKATGPTAYG